MHIRKLLIAGSALATAVALTMLPAAQANPAGGNIGSVWVGINTSGSWAATLGLKTGASITMDKFGVPTALNCPGGGGTGTANAGSPAPTPFMTFASLSLTCDAFDLLPAPSSTFSVPTNNCARLIMADDNVHDGLSDTGPKGGKFSVVDGTFTLPANCSITATSGPCTVTIRGTTAAHFNEYKVSAVTQSIRLTGSGLIVVAASFPCFGAVSVGTPVVLNNVEFPIGTSGGTVDFRDN
jgi:hypothetical protein